MKERIVSYSQVAEDIILYHLLKNTHNCFWIDVGANDPFILSVTKLFYDKGGHGINIEPLSRYAEIYKTERPNDINLQCGVGNKNGKMVLYGNDTGASFLYGHSEKEEHEVDIFTLENICDKYIETDKEINFLKIDVEGFEKSVLEGMNFAKYRPWIIVIESYENMTNKPVYLEWENLIVGSRYSFVFEFEQNRYYVADEKKSSITEGLDIEQILEQYEIYNISKLIEDNARDSVIVNSKAWKTTRKLLDVIDFGRRKQ